MHFALLGVLKTGYSTAAAGTIPSGCGDVADGLYHLGHVWGLLLPKIASALTPDASMHSDCYRVTD